ncbi:MAG TPA: hypothetical protein VFX12_03235 [Vicinamibacterales bacterium]|nr:hypothetical protein [Vicinamibacterales bacterium]
MNLIGPIDLRLVQVGPSLTGQLSLYGSTSTAAVPGPVHGNVEGQEPATIELEGTLFQPEDSVKITLMRWRVDASGDAITGSYQVRTEFDNFWGHQVYQEGHQIKTLIRSSS